MSEAVAAGGWWARRKAWWMSHHHRLMAIEDSAHAIALGMAIGIFFGFTPLWSLKTLLSIAVAWLLNSNKIAAAISVTLHDVILPFMPAIFWWEYKVGFYVLNGRMPARMRFGHISLQEFLHWRRFVSVIWPTFIGSVLLGVPVAIASYFVVKALVLRTRARRAAANSTPT
ncbi:MAG: DUF2062 domain-containing protein [Verrucomicrobiota bacterium]|nr:DUF2062 domain-containing protein [Verrucomicrobiota bacterium]